jgi:hypothetical protein
MKLKAHSNTFEVIKNFFIPNPTGAVIYLFISAILLGALNFKTFWHLLNGSLVVSSGGAALPSAYNSAFNNFWVYITQSRLLQILFWVFIGIVAYTLVWFIWNIINNLRNDVVAGDYVHPRSYTRASYWKSVLENKVIFAVSAIALVIYCLLLFKLFSVISSLFLSAIENFRLVNSLTLIVSSMLAGAFLLYFLVILGRITKNSWLSIYRGL